MRILLIDSVYKYGSTGKIVYDLYTKLNKQGHTAAVCYGRGKKESDHDVYKFSSDWEVYLHALLTRITGLTGCFSPFATINLIRYIKKFKPDIVHIHELHAYFVNYIPVIKYLKKNNIKTVWTFHCEFMYTGKCGYSYECIKWKKECDKCPHLKEYPRSLLLDYTKFMFNKKKNEFKDFNNLKIISPSKWLANRVKESFLGEKDIKVINNGIDTDNIFYPRVTERLKIKHNIISEKVILAVAPDLMEPRKGGRHVLELAKRIRDCNVKFILIGVKDLDEKFDDNVIALGRTNNQNELAEYYSLADIFIICSMKENFPTTCIEALSCGTPIIGFDEGGTKETAPDGYGIFVPFMDFDLLEKYTRLILSNQIPIKSKSECAKYGKNHYSKTKMLENYMIEYKELL